MSVNVCCKFPVLGYVMYIFTKIIIFSCYQLWQGAKYDAYAMIGWIINDRYVKLSSRYFTIKPVSTDRFWGVDQPIYMYKSLSH